MKLSKKGEYALRTLINLGIAAEVKRPLVQVSELADSEQLPVKFLEQIMHTLKEAGLIESQQGKFGGYRLAETTRQIIVTIGGVVLIARRPAGPDRLREPYGLRKMHLPRRGPLRPAHAHARRPLAHRGHPRSLHAGRCGRGHSPQIASRQYSAAVFGRGGRRQHLPRPPIGARARKVARGAKSPRPPRPMASCTSCSGTTPFDFFVMTHTIASQTSPATHSDWVALVREKVEGLRYGVVQQYRA